MGYNPGEKSGPREAVDFQGLIHPVLRMVHSYKQGKKTKGGRRHAWVNKEHLIELKHKEAACTRRDQGEVTWEGYRDAAQTSMHAFEKDCIYYWQKNKTECHHLQNSSQSTTSFESILLKSVLKIAGQLYRQQEKRQELQKNWKKEGTGN